MARVPPGTLTPCPLPQVGEPSPLTLSRMRERGSDSRACARQRYLIGAGSDRRAVRDHGIGLKPGVIVALRATASPHKSGGFTLIEMMAVLVLIGVVMAIVGGRVFQNFQSAQYKAG